MIKHLLSRLRLLPAIITLVAIASTAIPLSARDFKYTYDGKTITYTVIDEEAKTCQTKAGDFNDYSGKLYPGNTASGTLVLPENPYDGEVAYTLVEIGYCGLGSNKELTSVVIPNSVKIIGGYAFRYCSGLTSVEIPNSVTTIKSDAFCDCTGLTHVEIPNSVTTIEDGVFLGCHCLSSIVIPSSVTTIGCYAFTNCSRLKEAHFGSIESLCNIKFADYHANPLFFAQNLYIDGQLVKDLVIPNSVTSICDYAFCNCRNLTSVEIPNSVTSIGMWAFRYCTGLTTIVIPKSVTKLGDDVFGSCSSLKKTAYPNSLSPGFPIGVSGIAYDPNSAIFEDGCIYGPGKESLLFVPLDYKGNFIVPNTVTNIGALAFAACNGLNSIVITNSVTNIADDAFRGCSNLWKVAYPNTLSNSFGIAVTTISYNPDDAIFEDRCIYGPGKESLLFVPLDYKGEFKVSDSVKSIGSSAFFKCSGLTSVVIPNSVTSIGNYAFQSCSGLTSVDIPYSVASIDQNTFIGCTLETMRVNRAYTRDFFRGINSVNTIECRYCDLKTIKDYSLNVKKIIPFDSRYLYSIEPLLSGYTIKQTENPDFDKDLSVEVKNITAKAYDGSNLVAEIPVSENADNIVKGLTPGHDYTVEIGGIDSDGQDYLLYTQNFRTLVPVFVANTSSTQTTIQLENVECNSDETFNVKEMGVYYDGKKYSLKNNWKTKNLNPATTYFYTPYLIYNDNKEYKFAERSISTQGWNCNLSSSPVAPTSAVLTASFTQDDAKADKVWWEFDGQRVDGKSLPVVSLTPNSSYSATFYINYGEKTYNFSKSFNTSKIEFETLTPKGVSSSCSIVAAKTNISDLEPMAGFQWKKYDAPESLAPSKGYGAICDGVLEGYIKNLQPTSFYKVRPFFQDAKGKFYYGDWVTFDPSDFSYFDPTVRTYPVQEVSASSATVRGYALSGTDNIKSQGFQYWRSNSSKAMAFAPAAGEIITVPVSGQIMTATFENLDEGTTYTYRAYVETEAGFTYGEEQSFTTDVVNGVDTIAADAQTPTIVGYYDLSGHCYAHPQPGFNIVVYSDGSTKKMMLK